MCAIDVVRVCILVTNDPQKRRPATGVKRKDTTAPVFQQASPTKSQVRACSIQPLLDTVTVKQTSAWFASLKIDVHANEQE